MKFQAVTATADGKISKNVIYSGGFVWRLSASAQGANSGLRIVVWDNKGQWMTFDPRTFKPYHGEFKPGQTIEE